MKVHLHFSGYHTSFPSFISRPLLELPAEFLYFKTLSRLADSDFGDERTFVVKVRFCLPVLVLELFRQSFSFFIDLRKGLLEQFGVVCLLSLGLLCKCHSLLYLSSFWLK